MKIAVFGDSFVDRHHDHKSWWRLLETNHGHDVDCFGESGSSIVFSAKLILEHARNYDLIIWCVTAPGRFSIPTSNGQYLHLAGYQPDSSILVDEEKSLIINACNGFRKYVMHQDFENLEGKALVHYISTLHENVMTVPAFPPPVYVYPEHIGFNLYTLSEKESQYFFPKKSLSDTLVDWTDIRTGHLTKANHKILAHVINNNLRPGIFSSGYDWIVPPDEELDACFKKG
jgi:hypothetical protein